VVSFFYEDIICPKEILTDHGTHFVNEMLNSLCDKFGVKHNYCYTINPPNSYESFIGVQYPSEIVQNQYIRYSSLLLFSFHQLFNNDLFNHQLFHRIYRMYFLLSTTMQ
jgi:hypothetical protein